MKQVTAVLVFFALSSLALSGAYAQADLALKGVGFRIGLVDPEDVDATISFGFFADLGHVSSNVALETYFDFWTKSEDVLGGGEVSARDFVIGAKAKYIFPVSNPRIRPFAGGGLGFHVFTAGVDIPAIDYGGGFIAPAVSEDDTEIKVGLDMGGGIAFDINPGMAMLTEAWYTVVSDISQLSVKVGMMFRLGS
ncbi:MAG: outer membrane beta-barrel protein [Candidatus Latescibacteria bacterium]|nr:outer membrane beta-barrel protein [Candidatus Latescibacterota bacterium]NIO28370.1 outer membrane beta-barrel protein [Candidatus Latescibacterota bacterium]NIO55919.1 outer membrane beta-barrel protein [Candidatus Latescibacterota bacterium]NIT01883.1 outer membrane beta-barrel protein [Candidatus Latescibacterota bacterium]